MTEAVWRLSNEVSRTSSCRMSPCHSHAEIAPSINGAVKQITNCIL